MRPIQQPQRFPRSAATTGFHCSDRRHDGSQYWGNLHHLCCPYGIIHARTLTSTRRPRLGSHKLQNFDSTLGTCANSKRLIVKQFYKFGTLMT